MASEADLIAAIEAEPDDAAGYLVYGDLLQQRGDPRGELIALHHAGKRDAAERFLAAHRAELLGRLAGERAVELDWDLGFVATARIAVNRDDDACALLRVVADEPCCRFLRRLEVVLHGERRNYARIDETLAKLARPSTLRRIELGKPGDHALSAAVRDAFPQLVSNELWPPAVAAIEKLRPPATGIVSTDLPALAMRDRTPLPIDAEALVGALAAEVGRDKPLGVVAALAATCSAGDRDRYARALVAAWHRNGDRPVDAWVLDAAAVIGGRRAAWAIGRRVAGASHQRAEQAVAALARMQHSQATLELFAISRGHTKRAVQAERALAEQSAATGKTLGAMLARAGAGKLAAVEPEVAASAIELDNLAVEWLMTSAWTARVRAVVPWFVTSSRAPRTERLVWARHTRNGFAPFRWHVGNALDVAGAPVSLAPDDVVSIIHPAQLTDDQRERWRTVIREPPGFPQLDRELPLGHPSETAVHALVVERGLAPRETLHARGFRDGEFDFDMRELASVVKRYRWANVDYTVAVDLRDGQIYPSQPGLPLVVLHELARDLISSGSR